MRVAFIIITLSVLMGCTLYHNNVPWGVTMSNSRAVVLTLDINPSYANVLINRFTARALYRSIMLPRAQQECDHYGKDAVLIREERSYSYSRYHYRCETRQADPVVDVQ